MLYMKVQTLFVKGFLLPFTWLLLTFWTTSAQPGQVVSGKITDPYGDPLPGAVVQVKGTATGVTADADGLYSILANRGQVLVFSFLGMESKEVTVSSASLSVSLASENNRLDEAVAIGYGTQFKSLLTTSVSKVNEEEFVKAPSQNPFIQLQGKVPGLSVEVASGQPGESPTLFIRGGSSTNPGGDTPLIIVDGIISQGMRSISDMNPADIESIQVLKDAAATAIYGARAANGIILVKTKTGVRGKTKVTFKQVFGLDRKPRKFDLLNARDYIYLSRKNTAEFNRPELTYNGTADPGKFLVGSFGMSTGNPRNSKNTLEFLDTYINNYGADYVQDLIENQGWQTMVDPVTGKMLIFQDNDMQDATFRNAFKHEEDLTFSGGNDMGNYYLGLRHLKQDGTLRGTDYENYSFLFNGEYRISDAWMISAKATFQSRDATGGGTLSNSINRAILMPPTYRLWYEDGTPAEGEGSTSFRNRYHEIFYKSNYNYARVYRTSFQVGATWQIFDGLTFTPTVYYAGTEGITDTFEALNETTGTEIRPATASHGYDGHIQADAVLNYQKKIGQHSANVTLGGSYNKDMTYRLNASGSGSGVDLIPYLNATADTTQRANHYRTEEAIMSGFGRVSYDYDGKYMACVSLRADGSSRFSEGHKWGFFPGASVGWNIHKEPFFSSVRKVISTLKLRASWGRTGNNNLSLANSYGQYGLTGDNYMGEVGILNTTLRNSDLVWETTESVDLGLDLGFFGGRLGLIADVYNKDTYDRLYDEKLWNSTGFSSIKSNFGTVRNRGVELALDAIPISTAAFSWHLSATFAYNYSYVKELPDNGEVQHRVGGRIVYDPVTDSEHLVGGIAEGERYDGIWAFHYLGTYQTEEEAANAPTDPNAKSRIKHAGDAIFEDLNKDGILDAKDMILMGYTRPNMMGGVINEFRWKNLTARVVMDWSVGHVIDNGFLAQFMASSRNNNNATYEVLYNTWHHAGDGTLYPKYTVQSDFDYQYRNTYRWDNQIGHTASGSTNNSLYYSKGDYLAFREVSLSYRFPDSFVRSLRLGGLELFGGLYNLGYITAYSGRFPEIYNGLDYGIYERPRQYNIGLNITF